MSELKNEVRRRSYALKHHELMTVENVIVVIAVVLCFYWLWGSISSITRNWALAQEVVDKRREKAILELEIDNLELENEYYLSEEYLELAAKKYQNKMLDGETMVYLPNNTDYAKKSFDTQVVSAMPASEKSNFEQWLQLLLRI